MNKIWTQKLNIQVFNVKNNIDSIHHINLQLFTLKCLRYSTVSFQKFWMKLWMKEHVCAICAQTILQAIKSILYIMVLNHFLGVKISDSVPFDIKQSESPEIIKLKIERLPCRFCQIYLENFSLSVLLM